MPDLNLIDDGGMDEGGGSSPAPRPRKSGGGGGGGASKTILILLILLIVGAVAVFFLNKKGVIKLWGKKPAPAVTETQESEFPPDQMQAMNEQMGQQPVDSTQQTPLVEPPPVDEYAQVPQSGEGLPPATVEKKPGKVEAKTPKAGAKPEKLESTEKIGLESGSLADMKGEYTVQVIAFRERSKADQIVQNLTDAGYPAFVEKVPLKGGMWYTVRIGRYPTWGDAKKAVGSFAEQLRSSYVIDRIRTK